MKNLFISLGAAMLMLTEANAAVNVPQLSGTPKVTPCEGWELQGVSQHRAASRHARQETRLYNTPSGPCVHYSTTASLYSHVIKFTRFTGVANDVCIDGRDIYIGTLSPLTVAGNFWVKGTIDEQGDITILPQPVMDSDLGGYYDEAYTFGIAQLKLSEPDRNNQVSVIGIEQEGIKMHIDEQGIITSLNPKAYIALIVCDEQGQPVLSAAGNVQVEDYSYGFTLYPVIYPDVTLPEGAEQVPYNVIYRNHNNNQYSSLGGIYTDGSDVYACGLVPDQSDCYVKGTIADGKAVFPTGQFMRDVHNEDYEMIGYFGDFVHTFEGFEPTGEKDEEGYSLSRPLDQIVFDIDADGNYTLVANQYISDGEPGGHIYEYYWDMTLNQFKQDVVPVPVAPHEINLNDMTAKYGSTTFQVVFYWYNKSVDGEYIDPKQLSYRVFFDDYLYEFTPEFYPDFEGQDAVTEIGWYDDYESVYYYELFGMKMHIFFFYDDLFNTMGIQGINTVDGVRTYSDIAVVDHNGQRLPDLPASAIRQVAPDHANEVTYFDIQGHPIAAPEPGTFVIARMVMPDGKIRTLKVRR